MNVVQKSDAIKASLRKSFQDGSSKMARRKCYGYEVAPDGELFRIGHLFLTQIVFATVTSDFTISPSGALSLVVSPIYSLSTSAFLFPQGVGLSTFYILNRINSLCRSSFTAVFPMGAGVEIPFHEAVVFDLDSASADCLL